MVKSSSSPVDFGGATQTGPDSALRPRIGDVAIIAYLPRPVADFLAQLTARLAPAAPRAQAHLTLLPPQPPTAPLPRMAEHLGSTVASESAFSIHLDHLATFLPISEVLYIELSRGSGHARRLHEKLVRTYRGAVPERFLYHPHITLAYALEPGEIRQLLPEFQREWMQYAGSRDVLLEALTLVQLTAPLVWTDAATVPLKPEHKG